MTLYNDITFVMPTRFDFYGCKDKTSIKEMANKILFPIFSSKIYFPGSKFILVEYCPNDTDIRLKDVIAKMGNVKIITLKKQLHLDLQNDGNISEMNFYEHTSKNIGSHFVDTRNLIIFNQDGILLKHNTEQVQKELNDDKIVLAWKDKISYDFIDTHNIIETCEYLHSNPPRVTEHGPWGNGDFLGMSKQLFNELNGLDHLHQNWGVDNAILFRAGLINMNPIISEKYSIVRPYTFYSLDHPSDGMDRPFVGDVTDPFAHKGKKISQHIVDRIFSDYYVDEIIEK